MLLLEEPLFSILRDLYEKEGVTDALANGAQVYLLSWERRAQGIPSEVAVLAIKRADSVWAVHLPVRSCSCDIPREVRRWRYPYTLVGNGLFEQVPSPADLRELFSKSGLEEVVYNQEDRTLIVQHSIDKQVIDEILKFPQAEHLVAYGHRMPQHALPALWHDFSDQEIGRIAESLPELQTVHLVGQNNLTDACLEALIRHPKIRSIIVPGTKISNAAVSKARAAKPNLVIGWDFMREIMEKQPRN
jgi:hypothetical protein